MVFGEYLTPWTSGARRSETADSEPVYDFFALELRRESQSESTESESRVDEEFQRLRKFYLEQSISWWNEFSYDSTGGRHVDDEATRLLRPGAYKLQRTDGTEDGTFLYSEKGAVQYTPGWWDGKPFAQWLRERREERGYSTRGLAKVVGIAGNVSDYESGKKPISARLIKRFAQALEVEESEAMSRWVSHDLQRKGVAGAAPLSGFIAVTYNSNSKSFGEQLRDRLEEIGWSGSMLARKLNTSAASVTRWSKDQSLPKPNTTRKIANILGDRGLYNSFCSAVEKRALRAARKAVE